MAKDEKEKEEPQAPIEHGEVSAENPSGIEKVSDEHAMHLGTLQGNGGPGAAGCVVAGPVVHIATKGGTKPLPVRGGLPEGVKTSAGKKPGKHQKTSQEAALKSGEAEEEPSTDHNEELQPA